MKRSELIQKLVNEGMSAKTLANFNDNQINDLAKRMLGEQATQTSGKAPVTVSAKLPNAAQIATGLSNSGTPANIGEELKGGQKKLDKNHNGKIDAQDFKILRGQKKKEVKEDLKGDQKKIDANHNGKIDGQDFKILKAKKEDMKEADMGLTVKAPKSSGSVFGAPVKGAAKTTPKKKTAPKKKEVEATEEDESDDSLHDVIHNAIKEKLTKDLDREPTDDEVKDAHKNYVNDCKDDSNEEESDEKSDDESDMDESKPSAGLSKEKKSEVVKKAKKGGDIGKKGKGFEKLADKAAKEYGSKEKGEKVAAAAMWKNLNREQKEVNNWVNNLAESNFYHSFTSKEEIMELISTKLTEADMAVAHGPNVKKGHNGVPEFMSYESIKSAGPATAPTKPTVKPGTKPGEKPKTPYNPGKKPNPKPKASFE
jgi:hypothetical protein